MTRVSIRTLVFATIAMGGWLARPAAATESADVVVTIDVMVPGHTPDETAGIAFSIERAMLDLPGLTTLKSMSQGGRTTVWLQDRCTVDSATGAAGVLPDIHRRLAPLAAQWPAIAATAVVRWQRGALTTSLAVVPAEEATISVHVPEASAEAVEAGVTVPIEQALNVLPGIVRLRSDSGQGRSTTYAEMSPAIEVADTVRAIEEAVGRATQRFPAGAGAPVIVRSAVRFTPS